VKRVLAVSIAGSFYHGVRILELFATITETLSRAPALKALPTRSRTDRIGSLVAFSTCPISWSSTIRESVAA
jgi:hypothetical protein